MIDYGDYLAVSLSEMKDDWFQGFQWCLHPSLNWQDVAKLLDDELGEIQSQPLKWASATTTVAKPDTPWLNDVDRAAKILGTDHGQILFEIRAYEPQNQLCRSSIKQLIDEADFQDLAQQICNDKSILNFVFRDRPGEMLEFRRCITRV